MSCDHSMKGIFHREQAIRAREKVAVLYVYKGWRGKIHVSTHKEVLLSDTYRIYVREMIYFDLKMG